MDTQTIPSADPKPARATGRPSPAQDKDDVVINCKIDELYYGTFKAVRDTQIPIKKNSITAFIGPSGCGKSTVLRCLNRMNDLVRGFRFQGHVKYRGKDIYGAHIDPVAVRRYIGMVFQQPNPFATSIFNNVAFGLRINKFKGSKVEKVEQALKRPHCGMKSRINSTTAGCPCPAGNSNVSASPARWPPIPKCS